MDDAILSIVNWPDGFRDNHKVQALVKLAGVDAPRAKLLVTRGLPILLNMPGQAAGRAEAKLAKYGVDVFTPRISDVAQVPEPLRVKRLAWAEGAPTPMYMAEPWRGELRGLVCSDLFLLVRGMVRQSVTHAPINRKRLSSLRIGGALGGLAGAAAAGMMGDGNARGASDTHVRVKHVLDLYFHEAQPLRLDGDKFSFDVLGESRGLTDGQNMDALAVMLAEQAPSAIVDTSFHGFHVPPMLLKSVHSQTAGATIRRENMEPLFDFYSAWSYLKYRRIEILEDPMADL
jgi:hypothetical protein